MSRPRFHFSSSISISGSLKSLFKVNVDLQRLQPLFNTAPQFPIPARHFLAPGQGIAVEMDRLFFLAVVFRLHRFGVPVEKVRGLSVPEEDQQAAGDQQQSAAYFSNLKTYHGFKVRIL